MTQTGFSVTRERDAWATIRGFVYQVDLTILRWLELLDDEALELERGEDIDVISRALGANDDAEENRLLEQVKQRTGRLSLRSEPVLQALVDFLEHRKTNPDVRLQFRFTTNARAGRELNSPLPRGLAGPDAWKLLRERREDVIVDGSSILAGIRELLLSSRQPMAVGSERWKAFLEWLSGTSEADLLQFIQAFEWAFLTPDSPTLSLKVEAALVELGLSQAQDARQLYRSLFFHVFKLLSHPGLKRLTRADLQSQLAAPPSEDDLTLRRLAALHDQLVLRLEEHEGRLDLQEKAIAELATALQTTSVKVEEIARDKGIISAIDFSSTTVTSLEEPVGAQHASARSLTIDSIIGTGSPPLLVSLWGAAESGKTQLALLVSRRLGRRRRWIRLANSEKQTATAQIVRSVLSVSGKRVSLSAPIDWQGACTAFAALVDVLVLDDMPQFNDGDPLGLHLRTLIGALVAQGRSIIVTSATPLARLGRIIDTLSPIEVPVPPLDRNEVEEVLRGFAAPTNVLESQVANLIVGVTKGHPRLLQAVAQFLRERHWAFTTEVLTDLFASRYAEPLHQETVGALLEGVTDDQTRELLYRLNMINSPFQLEDVSALAEIEPQVPRPTERLNSLLGPWIEFQGSGKYIVSPLVGVLGHGNLDVSTKKSCHAVLARRIVSAKRIGEFQLNSALIHFVAAEDFFGAGVLLVRALQSLTTAPPDVARRSLVSKVWADAPLPIAMDVSVRLLIRAHQAVLAQRLGNDPLPFVEQVKAILAESPAPSEWADFIASVQLFVHFATTDVAVGGAYLLRSIRIWPRMRTQIPDLASILDRSEVGGAAGLVWALSTAVNTREDLDSWLGTVEQLPPDLRAKAWTAPIGHEGAMSLANRMSLREYQRPSSERSWSVVANDLRILENRARTLGATTLAAAALAARLSAMAEGGIEIEAVSREGNKAIAAGGQAADDDFLIAKSLGLAALDKGDSANAVAWLERAAGIQGSHHTLDRIHVRVRLARLVSPTSPAKGVELVQEALAMASDRRPLVEGLTLAQPARTQSLLVAQIQGELALAAWQAGDTNTSANALLGMIAGVLEGRADNDSRWNALFVTAGHVSGYLTSVITGDGPPDTTASGDRYAVPEIGVLLAPVEAAASLYDPKKIGFLSAQAARVADAIGDGEEAVQWASRAVASLKAEGLWMALSVPLQVLVEHAIANDDFATAIEFGIDSAAAVSMAMDIGVQKVDILSPVAPPKESSGVRTPGASGRNVDSMVASHVVLPAFLQVAVIHLTDPTRARLIATSLRDACAAAGGVKSIPGAAREISSDLWTEAARLCQDVFLEPADRMLLETRLRAFRDGGDSTSCLAVMAYVGVSLHSTTSIESAAGLHAAIGAYIQSALKHSPRLYEETALRFFSTFWSKAIVENRAHFRTPDLIGLEINEASATAPRQRLQRLVAAVAQGLGIALSNPIKQWIKT